MAYPDTEIRIVDTQVSEVEVSPGGVGELLVRGPQIMKGYWKAPEETMRVLIDGWLHTGDVVRIDEEGWLYIVGRKRDRIVAAGHTVWPIDVEAALTSSPEVELAIAIGAPDPLRCDTAIHALVVLKRGYNKKEVEARLLHLCREKLQPHQIPERIEVVDSLPLTNMGEIDRIAVETEIERRLKKAMDDYTQNNSPNKS
jgi:long-chain acyl-CoA synthetase